MTVQIDLKTIFKVNLANFSLEMAIRYCHSCLSAKLATTRWISEVLVRPAINYSNVKPDVEHR